MVNLKITSSRSRCPTQNYFVLLSKVLQPEKKRDLDEPSFQVG